MNEKGCGMPLFIVGVGRGREPGVVEGVAELGDNKKRALVIDLEGETPPTKPNLFVVGVGSGRDRGVCGEVAWIFAAPDPSGTLSRNALRELMLGGRIPDWVCA